FRGACVRVVTPVRRDRFRLFRGELGQFSFFPSFSFEPQILAAGPRIGQPQSAQTFAPLYFRCRMEARDATESLSGVRSGRPLVLLVLLLSTGFGAASLYYNRGVFLLPLDDSYIYLRYADRLVAGEPLRYSAGDRPSTGATSLLYPLLLAPGRGLGLSGDGLALFPFPLGVGRFAASARPLRWLLSPGFAATVALASPGSLSRSAPPV